MFLYEYLIFSPFYFIGGLGLVGGGIYCWVAARSPRNRETWARQGRDVRETYVECLGLGGAFLILLGVGLFLSELRWYAPI